MEGLKLPTAVNKKMKFLFFNSNLYSERISKRFDITQKVLKKQKIEFIDYSISGDSKLLAALEVLLLGSWISYYMTILNDQNPVAIPHVDFFKKELGK
jgi:glucose/mannose-6-phosphate isomerase